MTGDELYQENLQVIEGAHAGSSDGLADVAGILKSVSASLHPHDKRLCTDLMAYWTSQRKMTLPAGLKEYLSHVAATVARSSRLPDSQNWDIAVSSVAMEIFLSKSQYHQWKQDN